MIQLLSAIILFSCAKNQVFVTQDFKSRTIDGGSLAIIFPDKPKINNINDLFDDLGYGIPENVYLEFFKSKFPNYLLQNSKFKQIEFSDKKLELVDWSLKEELNMKLPEKGETINFNDSNVDFVLFIEDLEISRKLNESKMRVPKGSGAVRNFYGASIGKLIHTGKFAIWDNKSGQLVSFGKLNVKNGFVYTMSGKSWEKALMSLSKKIVQDSPFEKSI